MKKIISFLVLITILASFCANIPMSAKTVFSDVPEDKWFYECANRAKELGYMNGTTETEFSPYEPVNRAMAVQVLYNLSGEKGEYSPYFKDVAKKSWYSEAVCWAKERGIANGTSADSFSPSRLMTREQLACFIERYISLFKPDIKNDSTIKYADLSNASSWAKNSVELMGSLNIMTPRVYDFFYPEATVSRAEFAYFVLMMMGEKDITPDTSAHVQLIYTNTANATLQKGQNLSLKALMYPANADDSKVSFASSDASKVSVDAEGKLTALSAGKVKITVTSRDGGFKAYSEITVAEPLKPGYSTSSKEGIYNSSADNSGMNPISTGRYIDPSKPMVALTYDDGPHRTYTTQILNTYEKYNAVATFFELGERAVNCGDIIKREVELGCEVGNHSYSHPNLANLSASEVYKQINDTNNVIYKASGTWPKLVRPPYGSLSTTAKANIGAPAINWSVDTLDWKYRDASYVTSVIKTNVTDGSIVLMHSLYSSTARATEIIVPWLLSQGYQLVTVSELAEARGVNLQNGKVYYSFYD